MPHLTNGTSECHWQARTERDPVWVSEALMDAADKTLDRALRLVERRVGPRSAATAVPLQVELRSEAISWIADLAGAGFSALLRAPKRTVYHYECE
jgi:hypothetical protein